MSGTILYLSSFELPDKEAASLRVVSNAKLFRSLGYRVVFLDTDAEQTERLRKKEPCYGFERWSIPKSYRYLYDIAEHITVAEQIDDLKAVIAYNHPAVGLWRLKRYCNRRGVKMMADTTEWYAAEGPNLLHRIIKGADTALRMRFVQPRLDGLIVISKYLEAYYRDKTKTILLPPLTDCEDGKWQAEAKTSADERLRILYAGSPGINKDKLSLVIRALAKCDLTKVLFTVVGLAKAQYLEAYPQDAQVLESLADSIVFLGRVPHGDVIRELKSADFSLFYREETRVTKAGFPTKFAEAITCGTPVMTSHNSDLGEYLADGVNGFFIDDLDKDLPRILNKDVHALKRMKANVDAKRFDYRNYLDTVQRAFEHWL